MLWRSIIRLYPQIVLHGLEGEMCTLRWRDALLVPVPKKGDLSSCDNWRGIRISLLDVMGKLFARVLNDRLQLVVEEADSDSKVWVQGW